MDIFDTIMLESELSLMKSNHIWLCEYGEYEVHCKEIELSPVLEEVTKEEMLKDSNKSIVAKVVEAIQKIIDTIKDVCLRLKKAVVDKFTSKDVKDKLDKAEEALKNNPNLTKEKVKMLSDDETKKQLDNYVREMAKLERELLNLKVETDSRYGAHGKKSVNMAQIVFQVNQISKKMDDLNKKYDDILESHEKLVEMALEDAIRFNNKQLDNIKIDYDAVEQNASKILKEFKQDASGCDVPVKYNLIQKMANAIGTRVRKYLKKKTEYHKNNLLKILGVVGIVAAGKYVATKYVTDPQNFPKNIMDGPAKFKNAMSASMKAAQQDANAAGQQAAQNS